MSDEPQLQYDDLDEAQRTWETQARHLRTIGETMLRDVWGDRCLDYEETCEVCRRWKLLDDFCEWNPQSHSAVQEAAR